MMKGSNLPAPVSLQKRATLLSNLLVLSYNWRGEPLDKKNKPSPLGISKINRIKKNKRIESFLSILDWICWVVGENVNDVVKMFNLCAIWEKHSRAKRAEV